MAKCDECGEHENMPYQCKRCEQKFCAEHRLPENHDCRVAADWDDSDDVFDNGYDSVEDQGNTPKAKGIADRVMSMGEPLSYFRGNMAYTILAVMWATFLLQWLILITVGPGLHQTLFVLRPAFPEYVWTWITSVFAHSPRNFSHIVFNSMVIFFFAPLVERYVGSKEFGLLFVLSGVLAGVSQTLLTIFEGGVTASTPGVLGASGAALAIMGVLTVLNPRLKVLIYFLIPAPIWLLTIGTAAVSIFYIGAGQAGGGGIAHGAHIVGLFVGLAYGQYVKRTQNIRTQNRLRLGGGPGSSGGPGRGRS